jgi:hypothetical protein
MEQYSMTEPEQSVHFAGFADRGVPTPGWEWLEVDEGAGRYGETGVYFRGVGQEHATGVINDVLRLRREPGFQVPYDFIAAVTEFRPHIEYQFSLGHESEHNDRDYIAGFVDELVEEAHRIRSALDAQQRGETYQPDLYPEDQQRLGDWAAGFSVGRGDLSSTDLMAVADQFDDLARTISGNTREPLPYPLRILDERRLKDAQDQAALAELTVAIDRYSIHRAAPYLVSGLPGLTGDQARTVERDRLAARIAVLDTRTPFVLDSLSADRAQVLHYLLPESAARQNREYWRTRQPRMPIASDDDMQAFASAVDRAWTWVAAQSPETVTPAELAPVSDFLDTIADAVRQDPALADHLPTIQAGLARHLAEHHLPPDDATHRLPGPGPTSSPDVSADRGSSDQVDAAPATATASPQSRALTSASSRHPLPGTAGTRHTTSTHQPGNGRTQ